MERRTSHRPQLSPDELQQLRWLFGGVLTLVSVWTVLYLEVQAWALTAAATVGVLATLVKPAWPARIPRWVHRLAFPVIVAVFVGDLWLSGELLPAMVRLDILLLAYRGITYRKKRDDLQVIVLGLFLVVVAGVLTVSLTFAVQILIFTLGALGFLLLITLTEANSRGAVPVQGGPAHPRLDEAPGWAVHVQWSQLARRVPAALDWRIVTLGGALFIALVGLSALLFLAIPRFQLENSLFLERFITKKTKTGFNDTIRFGEVTGIQQDESVALSVDVSDRMRIPASPYWRMLVLDEYREGAFRLSAQLRRAAFLPEQRRTVVRGRGRNAAASPDMWTFYLEAGVSRYLPLLGPFATLRFQELQNWSAAPSLGIVGLRNEPATMTAYRVEAMEYGPVQLDPAFASRVRTPPVTPSGKQLAMLALTLGEPDQRAVAEILLEIGAGESFGVTEFGKRTSEWIARKHTYSLEPSIPSGPGDPVVRWLSATGGGHCELFAGSLVVLARAAGIPARVVIGFRGGSWNGYSNNFTLRNSDAHAWCELYDAAVGGWVRIDPTPGAANAEAEEAQSEAALRRRTDRSWTARLDSLRVFWYRRIVNFDQRSQIETLQSVKTATEKSGRQLRALLERAAAEVKAWSTRPWDVRAAAMLGGILLGAFLLLAGLRHLRGIGWRGFAWGRRSAASEVRQLAGRWLQRLASLPGSGELGGIRADLQRLRYGAPTTWPEPRQVFRQAKAAVRAKGRGV